MKTEREEQQCDALEALERIEAFAPPGREDDDIKLDYFLVRRALEQAQREREEVWGLWIK